MDSSHTTHHNTKFQETDSERQYSAFIHDLLELQGSMTMSGSPEYDTENAYPDTSCDWVIVAISQGFVEFYETPISSSGSYDASETIKNDETQGSVENPEHESRVDDSLCSMYPHPGSGEQSINISHPVRATISLSPYTSLAGVGSQFSGHSSHNDHSPSQEILDPRHANDASFSSDHSVEPSSWTDYASSDQVHGQAARVRKKEK